MSNQDNIDKLNQLRNELVALNHGFWHYQKPLIAGDYKTTDVYMKYIASRNKILEDITELQKVLQNAGQ